MGQARDGLAERLRLRHATAPAIPSTLDKTVLVPVSPIHPRLEQLYVGMQTELLLERRPPIDTLEAAALDAQQILDDWASKRKRS